MVFGNPAAADRTAETAFVPDQVVLCLPFTRYFFCVRVNRGFTEVLDRYGAVFVDYIDQDIGSISTQADSGNRVGLQFGPGIIDSGEETILVSYLDPQGASDRDRFQVLGTHDRAHPGASGGPVVIVHDIGELDKFLTSRTDSRHLGIIIHGFLDVISGLDDSLTPQIGSTAQFHGIVVDPQINRIRGFTFKYNAIITGIF